MPKTIVIGSMSPVKHEALRRALERLGQQATICYGEPSSSGVSEQPVGLDVIFEGASNRARAIRKAFPAADLAIGIENGIDLVDGGWVDLAALVAILPDGRETVVWSEAIKFPTVFVDAWATAGSVGTVGELIARECDCLPHDPHAFLTQGRRPRSDILADALTSLLDGKLTDL